MKLGLTVRWLMLTACAAGPSLVASARVIDLPKTGATPETTDLVAEVAAAKTDYDTSGGDYYHDPVTIRLAAGTYSLAEEILINWPLVVCGATGDADDVAITPTGSRTFSLNHASAMVHSLTIRDATYSYGGAAYSDKAQKHGLIRICGRDSSTVEWPSSYGSGGVISNVTVTACTLSDGVNVGGLVYVCGTGGLITHCRICGNTATRSSGNAANNLGLFLVANYGTVRNTLIANNTLNWKLTPTVYTSGACVAMASALARGGQLVNCTVTGNASVSGGKNTKSQDSASVGCAGVIGLGKVVNTLVYGNTAPNATLSHAATWSGTGSCFVNCAGDYAEADKPSEDCLALTESPFTSEDDLRPVKTSSCCGAGTVSSDYAYGETDLNFQPRTYTQAGVTKIDIGAYQHDTRVLTATCTFTGSLYDPMPTHLAALLDEGALGDAPVYYWDWESDGTTDLTTTESEIDHSFGLGSYHLSVCASNAAGTAGHAFTFDEGFSVGPQPVHLVDPSSPNPAPPYTTAETASHTIQAALDVTTPGAVVEVVAGTHTITRSLYLTNDFVTLRGATGNPEDVVIRPANGSLCRCLCVDAGPHALVHGLTFEAGRGGSGATDKRTNGGGGACLNICAKETGSETDSPEEGLGGVVSNCIVRCGRFGEKDDGGGTGKRERFRSGGAYLCGANAVLTHCVLSNNLNNSAMSTAGQGYWTGASALSVWNGARAEHCLVVGNTCTPLAQFQCTVTVGTNSVLRYSTVVGNVGQPIAGVNVAEGGHFEKCVIADNALRQSAGSSTRARRAVWGAFDYGRDVTYSGSTDYTTEATKAAAVGTDQTDDASTLADAGLGTGYVSGTLAQFFTDYAEGEYMPHKDSLLCDRIAPAAETSPMPLLDLAGHTRLRGEGYDLGAYEFYVKPLKATCTFTGPVYDLAPTHLAAILGDAGLGDAPVYYWDWESDGTTDLATTASEIDHSFGLGAYHLTVCASNAAGTVGYSFTFKEGFSVVPHPTHLVDPASANPTAPYTTAETAAHTIQAALDVALPGAIVVVAAETYAITRSLYLTNDYVTLCGATRRPGDVVVRPADGSYCRCLCVDAGPHALVHGLTFEAGRGGSGATDKRPNGGGGGCLNICAVETNGATDSPEDGLGGVVSNCIVRSGRFGERADGGGAGLKERFRSAGAYLCGANALLTHCVLSNNHNNSAMSTAGQGYWTGASALSVWNGAKAEHCLVAGNTCTPLAQFQCTVTVGTNSVLRYSTVVGNVGQPIAGVNVAEGGHFEKCVIANNTVWRNDTPSTRARRAVWGALDYGRDGTYTGTPDYAAEAAQAAVVGTNQTDDASTLADAGLGTGYVTGTLAEFFADYAAGNYMPPKYSPLCDRIAPADETSMPRRDLANDLRLWGTGYDLGAFERTRVRGLIVIVEGN